MSCSAQKNRSGLETDHTTDILFSGSRQKKGDRDFMLYPYLYPFPIFRIAGKTYPEGAHQPVTHYLAENMTFATFFTPL
jgi:hypothetical protein